jgi:hypothetical protein
MIGLAYLPVVRTRVTSMKKLIFMISKIDNAKNNMERKKITARDKTSNDSRINQVYKIIHGFLTVNKLFKTN